jgi:hypothetical protein
MCWHCMQQHRLDGRGCGTCSTAGSMALRSAAAVHLGTLAIHRHTTAQQALQLLQYWGEVWLCSV